MSSNSWLTILAATLFNVLFEYSLRGVNHLISQPLLFPILFTVYFTLFAMLNDLISRFNLKDYHLLVLALFFGTFYQFFASGAALLPPLTFGVNFRSIIFVVIVWWGVVQSIVTFYLANRVAPRDWGWRLSKTGWAIALTLNGLMMVIFQLSPNVPTPNISQLIILLTIMAVAAVAFKTLMPKGENRKILLTFQKSRALDILSITTISVFLFSALFLTFDPAFLTSSLVNFTATRVITIWTIILAIAVLSYRLFSRKPISV